MNNQKITYEQLKKIGEEFLKETRPSSERVECMTNIVNSFEYIQRLILAQHEKIESLESQINGGWIPCSERLPKIYEGTCTSEIVLVQGYDKEIDYEWQAMGWYAEESKQWYFAECKSTDKPINWINIIAWQPLPEPYKESEGA